jgi:prefoldin subunit 5
MSNNQLINLDQLNSKFNQIIQSTFGSTLEECEQNINYLQNQIEQLEISSDYLTNWKNDLNGLLNIVKNKKKTIRRSQKEK